MIKSIFFDFDGVLTLYESGIYTTFVSLKKFTKIPIFKFLSSYKQYKKNINLGKISFESVWGKFCKDLGQDINIKFLRKAFLSTPKNIKMLNLVKKLKKRYKTGIITNNNKERIDLLIEKFELDELFNKIVLSGNEKIAKPEEQIYKKALNYLKTLPNETIFIDNKRKNLTVPKKLGIKTIFYNSKKNNFEKFINKLKSYGVVF